MFEKRIFLTFQVFVFISNHSDEDRAILDEIVVQIQTKLGRCKREIRERRTRETGGS